MFWDTFVIHTAISMIRFFVHNPASPQAQRLKSDLIALRDAIDQLYPTG